MPSPIDLRDRVQRDAAGADEPLRAAAGTEPDAAIRSCCVARAGAGEVDDRR